MRIIGPPSAAKDRVITNARDLGAVVLFTADMLPALWDAALRYHVDPVGVVAQAFKETGGGKFGGRVLPGFFNTCGLKVRDPNLVARFTGDTDADQPLAHAMFPNWAVGAAAHVQHLRAYTGWAVTHDLIVDPRYVWVIGRHALVDFDQLGGKWAPSRTYGTELVAIAEKLRA